MKCKDCKWISKEASKTSPDYKLCKCPKVNEDYEEVCVKHGTDSCPSFEEKQNDL